MLGGRKPVLIQALHGPRATTKMLAKARYAPIGGVANGAKERGPGQPLKRVVLRRKSVCPTE
eukprot:6101308-Amphidinium_carterae.1